MATFTNTITGVELNIPASNGSMYHKIQFTKQNGQPGSAAVFQGTPAFGAVSGLQPGQVVSVETDANRRVINITPGAAQKNSYTKPKSFTGAPTQDRELGLQLGNALNVAATILGAGISVKELITTAREIIKAGNSLKEELKSGALDAKGEEAPKNSPPPVQAPQQPNYYQMPQQQGNTGHGIPI